MGLGEGLGGDGSRLSQADLGLGEGLGGGGGLRRPRRTLSSSSMRYAGRWKGMGRLGGLVIVLVVVGGGLFGGLVMPPVAVGCGLLVRDGLLVLVEGVRSVSDVTAKGEL